MTKPDSLEPFRLELLSPVMALAQFFVPHLLTKAHCGYFAPSSTTPLVWSLSISSNGKSGIQHSRPPDHPSRDHAGARDLGAGLVLQLVPQYSHKVAYGLSRLLHCAVGLAFVPRRTLGYYFTPVVLSERLSDCGDGPLSIRLEDDVPCFTPWVSPRR